MQTSASNNCGTARSLQSRRLVHHILLDLLIFIVLLIPIVVCEFGIVPFRRGFFCTDETIRYPFKSNTITPVILGLIVGLPPIIILIVGEYAHEYSKGQLSNTRIIFNRNVPTWIVNFLNQFLYFCFGLLLTFNATEVGKYTIGRLRPHFIAVCQPQIIDGTTCNDPVNQHRYIENYFCLGSGYTVQDVRQARLSFPSGHSSLAFYALVYVALYLQKRIYWRRSNLTRHFIQFALIMVAWFTALTRVMDSWHHWSDVLVGSLIGVLGAIITANYISKLFRTSYSSFGSLQLPGLARQDTSATLNEVLAVTPPPYTINQQQQMNAFTNETYCTKV